MLAKDRHKVVELPCSGADDAMPGFSGSSTGNGVVHLTSCKVSGFQKFSDSYPGLAFLRPFHDNLPEDGVEGAYFRVHLRQYSRRRTSSWNNIEKIAGLQATTVYSPTVRIGAFGGLESLFRSLPGQRVPLRQSPDFHQEMGMWSGVTLPYSSKNMLVGGDNTLYTSKQAANDNAYDDDVEMWFTVANSREVSVLARQPYRNHLAPYAVPWFPINGGDLTLIETGAVPASSMFNELELHSNANAQFVRTGGALLCWLATWLLVFPAYVSDCCKKNSVHFGQDCGSCCRALPLSLAPTLSTIATAWAFQRSAALTMGVATVLAVACAFLARSAPLHQRQQPRQWPGGRRPTVGSAVRVRSDPGQPDLAGLTGEILIDDHSDLPYKISLSNGTTDWFKEEQVEWQEEGEAEAAPQPGPEAPAAPQGQDAPEARPELQQPLLPAEAAEGGAPGRGTSHLVRVMALGAAIGLTTSVVAMVVVSATAD